MKTKRLVRALFLTVIAFVISLIGATALACTPESNEPVPAGPEGGEYYYDAGGTEYLITLKDGQVFTFVLGDENREGSYAIAGTALTLTFQAANGEAPETLDVTMQGYNSLTFTYKSVSYTFLRKTMYTVSFSTDGGSAVPNATVLNGKQVTRPADPTKNGMKFVGWYVDSGLKTKYNFGTPVTADLTLYARYVSAIPADPEFTVSFAPGEGVDAIENRTTLQGKVYDLPEPTKAGDTFVGWWVSAMNSADELTYRYEEQQLFENTTLFAVWESDLDGAPAVSVTADGVSWTGSGDSEVSITSPSGVPFSQKQNNANTFAFSSSTFMPAAAGKYTVSVTVGGKTTTVSYYHKLLARVSVFKVEGGVLQFNAVANATSYAIEVTCGDGKHTETVTSTYYDFSDCEMIPDGILFTVTAKADGYADSVAKTSFEQTLPQATGFAVDDATQKLTWDEVAGATSYHLNVTVGSETVYEGDVEERSYDLKQYDPATVKVTVVPKAHGWNSPAAAAFTYEKTKLAAPKDLTLTGSTLSWTAVKGAKGYIVTVNGTPRAEQTETSVTLTDADKNAQGATEITVVAVAADVKNNSVASDVFRASGNGNVANAKYEAGVFSWDAVFGATKYEVKVNGGDVMTVSDTHTAVTLTAKANTLSVRVAGTSEDAWKEISVTAYEITFDLGFESPADPVYRATGDPMNLPENLAKPTRLGYDFKAWNYNDQPYTLDTFNGTADMKLTATWRAHEHTVTFDAAGGTFDDLENTPGKTTETYAFGQGDKVAPRPTPAQDGYAFEGWYTMSNGNGERYFKHTGEPEFPYNVDNDLTLYAHYVSVLSFQEEKDGTWRVSKGEYINLVTEVTVPGRYRGGKVTAVSDFSNCRQLVTLRLPDTITTVDLGQSAIAFEGDSALAVIEVYHVIGNGDTPTYYSKDGVLFRQNPDTKQDKTLVFYPFKMLEVNTSYTIPDDVSAIAEGAFYSESLSLSHKLETINIPASVAQIGSKAFTGIYSLKNINFLPVQTGQTEAASLTIAKDAFNGYATSNVTSITFPKRLADLDMELLMAFRSLTSIDVEKGNEHFSAEDGILYRPYDGSKELAFYPRGSAETSFTIPNGVVSVGENAFKNYTKLETLIVPQHVKNIGKSAFEGCYQLETLTFQGDADSPDLVIGEKAFYGFRKATSSSGFDSYNNAMTELRLPANLTSMGNMAFARLQNVTEVWVDSDRAEVTFAENAFIDADHNNLSYVTTVHIGAGVPAFEITEVFGSKLKAVYVAEGSKTFYSDDKGVLYNFDMDKLLFFPDDWTEEYVLPQKVTKISKNGFANKNLTGIVIHSNVSEIGMNAFLNCKSLMSVTFVEADDHKQAEELSIGAFAFQGCAVLNDITLPSNLVYIGMGAFASCTALTDIEIPASVKTLELGSGMDDNSRPKDDRFYIFYGCPKLNLTFAKGSHYYGEHDGVLYSLRAVTESGATKYVEDTLIYCPESITTDITVPSSVRRVASYAFAGSHVNKITFEDLVKTENVDAENPDANELTLSAFAFGNNSTAGNYGHMKEIHFPVGLKAFELNTISGCPDLTTFNVPTSVTRIASRAFVGLDSLTDLVFDAGGTEGLTIEDATETKDNYGTTWTGTFVFSNLTSITFPERLVYLGSNNFTGTESHGSVNSYYIQNVTFTDSQGKFSLEIAGNAFYSVRSLTSITLAEGLASIGEKAFYMCSQLQEVRFPASLTTIGAQAFSSCSKLQTLDFAENSSLTEFADGADYGVFYRCTSLEEVTLPASLTKIGSNTFNGCTSLTTVTIPENNHLAMIGSSAFSGCTKLGTLNFGKSAEDVELTFGSSSFANSVLTKFVFPANTVEIGENAFSGSSRLATVTFEVDGTTKKSKLTKIAAGAFQKTALSSISFPETVGDLTLGANMFKGCKSLTEVSIPKTVVSVSGLLNGCGSVQTVTIDGENPNLKADEKQPIIYDGSGNSVLLIYRAINSITIGEGATMIGEGAFANQTELTSITIPATVTTIGAFAFENCINLQTISFTAGSALTTLGKAAFHNCKSLTSLNLEVCSMLTTIESNIGGTTGVQSQGAQIFTGCTSLESVKFPAGWVAEDKFHPNNATNRTGTTIDCIFEKSPVKNYDFSLCTKLTQFGNYMFVNSAVESVILPTSLTHIGTYCFDGCANLSRMTADASKMASLEEGTIDLSGLTSMQYMYDRPNEAFTSSFNVNTSTSSNYTFRGCEAIKKVILPPLVQFLGGCYFQNCTNLATIEGLDHVVGLASTNIFANTALTSVTINKDVTKLGGSMFKDCAKLSEVNFADPSKITSLGSNMFQNCKSLTSFDFSQFTGFAKTNPLANANIFQGSGLTSADLTSFEGMTTLPNYTFADCADLKEVKLPTSMTYLGSNTFQNCTSLSKINSETEGTFDLSGLALTLIGTSATKGDTSGKAYTFDGCESVQKVILPEKCTKLAGWVFQNCTNLTEINLDKVTQIGNYCFSNTGFKKLVLTKTVTSFGEGAFMNCANLQELVLRGFASISGKWLFAECPKLESVVVPTTLTHLGTYTFQNDVNLSRIVANDSAEDEALNAAIKAVELGTFDFSGCTKLTRFSSGATTAVTSSVDSYIFAGCVGLKKIVLPVGFVQVAGYAFDGCVNLTEFDFTNITNIGRLAFRNTGLTKVDLGAKLTVNVFYSPFDGCENLTQVTLSKDNTAVKLENGSLIDIKNNKVLAALPNVVLLDEANGTLTLPDTLKTLADYAFYGMGGVTKVDLSKTQVTKIPKYAFYGSSVEEVVFPEGLTEIGDYAFASSAFKTMNYPTSLTKLGSYVFSGSAVENMEIPNTVTTIGASLFYLCENLQSVTFADAAADGSSAALTISGGNSGVPKDTTQSENRGTFEYSSVQKVTLGNRITEIPIRMFAYTKLTSFMIPETVTFIKRGTFFGSALTNIVIPGTVLKVDQEAFQASKLQSVKFDNGDPLASTPYNLFQGCTELTQVDLGNRFTVIPYSFFEDCTALETVVIPEGVVEINGAFKNCTALSSLTLPSSLERLLDTRNTFENTPNLKQLVIPEGVAQINKSVFFGMTKEQHVYFVGSAYTTAQLCGLDWMFNSEATFSFGYSEEEKAPEAAASLASMEAMLPESGKYGA